MKQTICAPKEMRATKWRLPMLVFALLSTGALAQSQAARSLRDSLTHDGMVQISDGLFARTTDNGKTHDESYVAINHAGKQALLAIALRDRQRQARINPNAAASQENAVNTLINQLSQPAAVALSREQDIHGDCNGIDPSTAFHVYVGAGPLTSKALAQNLMPSPVLNTTNKAGASISDPSGNVISSQGATTYASTDASAIATAPQGHGCTGYAYGSVTCPAGGGISAYATSVVTVGGQSCIR